MEFSGGSNVYLRASVTRRQYTIPATFPVREPFDVVYLPAVATNQSKKYELEWSKGVIVESPYAFPRLSNEAGNGSNNSNKANIENEEKEKERDGKEKVNNKMNSAHHGSFVTLGDLKHPTDASICMLLTDSFHKGIFMIHFGLDHKNCIWLNPHNSWQTILRNARHQGSQTKSLALADYPDMDIPLNVTLLDIAQAAQCVEFQHHLYHQTTATTHFTETQRQREVLRQCQEKDRYEPPYSCFL
jgi:hypothetical protein